MAKITIHSYNEYHALYGGYKERQKVGNILQAYISHCFESKGERGLLFSIVEIVNLNNPSLHGVGDILFFTDTDDDERNLKIRALYLDIINRVEKRFGHSIAEYSDWYEKDTYIVTVVNEEADKSQLPEGEWRPKFYSRDIPKQKDKYGFLPFDSQDKSFKQFVDEYIEYYVGLLQEDLNFGRFPYYVIILKPIVTKNKHEVVKLGNWYLHFATDAPFDKTFYDKFLNDLRLIWMNEFSGAIIHQIKDQVKRDFKKEVDEKNRTYLPDIWSERPRLKFRRELIKKLDEPFGKSDKTIYDFFYEVFIGANSQIYTDHLNDLEKIILEEFIPAVLSFYGWSSKGRLEGKGIDEIIDKIKRDVEHKLFIDSSDDKLMLFTHLIALRHIFNICLCCFGLDTLSTHKMMVGLQKGGLKIQTLDELKSYNNDRLRMYNSTNNIKAGEDIKTHLTTYFTKLFVFSPQQKSKNIVSFGNKDCFYSASIYEISFLQKCVAVISNLIKNESKSEYNKKAYGDVQLNSIGLAENANSKVSKLAVSDFKSLCNENSIIPEKLKEQAEKYLQPPILDCGAGLGDIAFKAFKDKEAILIDVNPIIDQEYPISKLHTPVVGNFLEYTPDNKIKTLLISHTLQFIDEPIVRLNEHIDLLAPENIILVLNKNDDFMGHLLKWTNENYDNANPEEKISNFPLGYKQVHVIPFKAELKCDTFTQLAKQISYLMMFDLDKTGDLLEKFLRAKLKTPGFVFNQVIEIYQREITAA